MVGLPLHFVTDVGEIGGTKQGETAAQYLKVSAKIKTDFYNWKMSFQGHWRMF
ncbi:MAG: hypothetical protein HC768_22485 [Acaryochloris sp. CRU_2_0]|nr:hypothetical protein [Acaryochloris sp. CRU_2_0]